jgi:hypothetical protein
VLPATSQATLSQLPILRLFIIENAAKRGDKDLLFLRIHFCAGLLGEVVLVWGHIDESPFLEISDFPKLSEIGN